MSNRSSIFDFKTISGVRGVPWGALVALGVIVFVNTLAVLLPIDDYLPSVYFPRHEIAMKHRTMKQYISIGDTPEVIFLGSSIANNGFDPTVFNDYMSAKGRPIEAFNFGVNGAGPEVFHKLLKYVLVPETGARYVVYGLGPVELNNSSRIFLEDQQVILDSPFFEAERDTLYPRARLKKLLFKYFKLFRIKEVFWPNWFTNKPTWLTTRDYALKEKGQTRITDIARLWVYRNLWPKWVVELNDKRMADLFGEYTATGYNSERLVDLIEFCKNNNITLVLVNMPRLTDPEQLAGTVYMDLITSTGGLSSIEMYDRKLTEICSEHKVDCLDFSSDPYFNVNDFTDPLHLYMSGARKLTLKVAVHINNIESNRKARVGEQ